MIKSEEITKRILSCIAVSTRRELDKLVEEEFDANIS
jgi:hypothetical protein